MDSNTVPSDNLKHNQNDNVRQRGVLDMTTKNYRNKSKVDEEIEKFEKQFVWPVETSFDDSGYDPGSIMGDTDSVVNEPASNQDIQNGRGNMEEFNQVLQYENISVRVSPQLNFSPYIQHRVSSPSISLSTDSDCDSGANSLSSSPQNHSDRNTAQAELMSPAIVLSDIKEIKHCDNLESERLKINSNLVPGNHREISRPAMFCLIWA